MKFTFPLTLLALFTVSLSSAQTTPPAPPAPTAPTADALWAKVEEAVTAMKNPSEPTDTQEQAKAFYGKSFKAFDDALDQFIKAFPGDARRWDAKLFGASTATLRDRLEYPVKYDLKAGLAEIVAAADADPAAKAHASGILMMELVKDVERGTLSVADWMKRVDVHLTTYPDSRVNNYLADTRRMLPLITELKSKPLSLKFTAIDGREVDLEKMRGKVVLIDFWATWCEPCIRELPGLIRLYKARKDQGFEIVGVSLDEDLDRLGRFVKEVGIEWPQYADIKGVENDVATRLGVKIVPTMWLIGRDGMLISANAVDGIVEAIETALKK